MHHVVGALRTVISQQCCSFHVLREKKSALISSREKVDPAACFHAVRDCQRELANVAFVHPPFEEFLRGRPLVEEDDEPMHPKRSWQKQAVSCVEEVFLNESVWPSLSDPERALWHSGRGPLSSSPFTALPTFAVTRFDPQPFRVLLSWRLRLAMPLTSHSCRCGRPLDIFSRHRASCAEAGVLGRRVGSGIGCRTSLPRRRWSSLNERDVEGLGRRTASSGWQKIGDCCGWFAPLLRRPTRNRHHHGVPSPQGRTSNTRSSVHSRGRIAQSPPQERANLSRAARSRWKGTSCGACC